MSIFKEALNAYTIQNEQHREWYNDRRIDQLTRLTDVLEKRFPFKNIWALETGGSQSWADGMVGYYFAYLANHTKGKFCSVDLNHEIEDKVYEAYQSIDPNLEITHFTNDSISFLKNPPYIPNLVHLDSWDVNMKDPFPSALHGWREFEAIEALMPVGSIIVVDDNWYQGGWSEWWVGQEKEVIHFEYPIIGKGAHIYQWILSGDRHWNIWDANYKLIIQKTREK